VGTIRVGWTGEEDTREALAQARAGALDLEKSAYERSKNVYAFTPPAEHTAGAESHKPTTPKEAQR
jgi:hypothetical protein